MGILVVMKRSIFDCVAVNTQVVILYCSLARCYHWEKLGKEFMGSLCIFSHNYMLIYNYLKINS